MVPGQNWLFYNVRFLKPCLPSVCTILVSEKRTLKHQHYPGKILLQGRTLQDPVPFWGQGKGQTGKCHFMQTLWMEFTVDGVHC